MNSAVVPVTVLVDKSIDLFVNVSVVALPTSVSVEVGNVNVPVLEIVPITGLVNVLFVNVWVSSNVTTVLSIEWVTVLPLTEEVIPVPPAIVKSSVLNRTSIVLELSSAIVIAPPKSARLSSTYFLVAASWAFEGSVTFLITLLLASISPFEDNTMSPVVDVIVFPSIVKLSTNNSFNFLFESTKSSLLASTVPAVVGKKSV